MDEAANGQLSDVVALVREVLDVTGIYLHGSAVQGGLRPASDLDVLAVARRPTTDAERRRLVAGLLPVSGRPRPLELSVVAQDAVRPWRYPPVGDLLYGDWLREQFTAGVVPGPAPTPDLAVLVTVARRAGRPLYGPPPAEVFDPVPAADVLRAGAASVPELLAELHTDTRNVLLTLARIWTTAATGEIRSKDGAADWALSRLPAEHRPVLEHARAIYRGEAEERWSPELTARVPPLAGHLRERITDRLAG